MMTSRPSNHRGSTPTSTLRVSRLGRLGLVFAAILLGACRDEGAFPVPTPSDQRMATIEMVTTDSIVTLSLRVRGFDVSSVVSLSAALDYDSTQLSFVEEVPLQDGAMRASRDDRSRLIVAVAHPTGLPDDVVARFRFVARGSAPTRGLGLSVRELQLRDATSGLPGLLVAPSPVMMRAGGTY